MSNRESNSAHGKMHYATHYSEIRCDYIDEEDCFWRVDAWKTDDNDEEGSVIAYVDNITARVLYIDPIARLDPYAQDVINAKLDEIGLRIKAGTAETKIMTPVGEFVVTVTAVKGGTTSNGVLIPETFIRTYARNNGPEIREILDYMLEEYHEAR